MQLFFGNNPVRRVADLSLYGRALSQPGVDLGRLRKQRDSLKRWK